MSANASSISQEISLASSHIDDSPKKTSPITVETASQCMAGHDRHTTEDDANQNKLASKISSVLPERPATEMHSIPFNDAPTQKYTARSNGPAQPIG